VDVDPFLLMLIFMLLLFLAMNWFGKKKNAELQNQRLAAVQVGNHVRTHSGFYGRIVDVDGDAVTLESPSGVETIWHKNSIAGLGDPPFAVQADEEPAENTGDEAGFQGQPGRA